MNDIDPERHMIPEKTDAKNVWAEYFSLSRNKPPTPLLIEAMRYVSKKEKALDIGAGALKDTRYLLSRGFEVTALDPEPLMGEEAKTVSSDKFHPVVASFHAFEFPKNEYDIISAMYALPYCPAPRDVFYQTFKRMKRSLKTGGIFCGNFFGLNDERNVPDSGLIFLTRRDIAKLLKGFEIISFVEEEKDGWVTNGTPKHWHLFSVIARKKRLTFFF